MQHKKILHVVSISFSLSYFVGEQFSHFKKKGFSFFVACSASEHLQHYAKKMNFQVFPVSITRDISPLKDLKGVYQLVKLIKKNNIQIVIGHTPKGGLLAMIASYIAGVDQRIYFRHGLMYETATGFKKKLLKFIETLTGFFATKVVCVSPSILDISNREKLSNPCKNLMLNRGTCNGVDVARFSNNEPPETKKLKILLKIAEDEKIVGFVGRLVRDKGINELVGGWAQIKTAEPKAKLLLIGPLEERDSVSVETRNTIANDDSILHLGLIEDTQPYYALMDVFVLPSYREGFPTVALEAAAMGLPIVTSRATGCRDSIIDGQTGSFCDIEENDIAAKVLYYLKNPVIAQLNGTKGREMVVKYFRQEKIWDVIEKEILVR